MKGNMFVRAVFKVADNVKGLVFGGDLVAENLYKHKIKLNNK